MITNPSGPISVIPRWSLEEKRNTILDIFHTTKEVYVLKVRVLPTSVVANSAARVLGSKKELYLQDIEKLGSKRGVISQSIKDVLQVGQNSLPPASVPGPLPIALSKPLCCTSPEGGDTDFLQPAC